MGSSCLSRMVCITCACSLERPFGSRGRGGDEEEEEEEEENGGAACVPCRSMRAEGRLVDAAALELRLSAREDRMTERPEKAPRGGLAPARTALRACIPLVCRPSEDRPDLSMREPYPHNNFDILLGVTDGELSDGEPTGG